jgi:hypothetical protein
VDSVVIPASKNLHNNGLMHRSKPRRHSITSLTWASSNCGTSRPSGKALTPSREHAATALRFSCFADLNPRVMNMR